MAEVTIEISYFFGKLNTDLSECNICEDIIYSNMFVLIMQFGKADNLKFIDADIKLCQSCFNLSQYSCH